MDGVIIVGIKYPLLNMEQLSLDDAIERSYGGADHEWKKYAEYIVHQLCKSRSTFTTDSVWSQLQGCGLVTRDTRALGAIMRYAAQSKWCKNSGEYRKSVRKVCHKRPIAIWHSLLFEHNPSLNT